MKLIFGRTVVTLLDGKGNPGSQLQLTLNVKQVDEKKALELSQLCEATAQYIKDIYLKNPSTNHFKVGINVGILRTHEYEQSLKKKAADEINKKLSIYKEQLKKEQEERFAKKRQAQEAKKKSVKNVPKNKKKTTAK